MVKLARWRLGRSGRRRLVVCAAAVLFGGLLAAAATGRGAAAAALTGLLVAVLLGVVLRVHRNQVSMMAQLRGLRGLEDAQRRTLDAVEKHRAGADRGQRDVLTTVQRQTTRLLGAQREQTREFEALLQLYRGAPARAPMPPSGHWALNATNLLDLLHLVRRRRPRLVLELGSGTSTVWLGYAVEQWGGRLISIDHKEEYAEQTRSWVSAHGLDGVVAVRDAPLRAVTVGTETFQWYDPTVFADLDGIDLLLVDGPPGATGPQARFPAVHLLLDRLSPVATVVLDDAERADEVETVRRWTADVTGLTRQREILGSHAVLSYARPLEPALRSA
jgi:predicted O-methyltransferase YrrM